MFPIQQNRGETPFKAEAELHGLQERLERGFAEFGFPEAQIMEIHRGPTVITCEFDPGTGVRETTIQSSLRDICRRAQVKGTPRLVHPEGSCNLAIEIPLAKREIVDFYDVVIPDTEMVLYSLPFIIGYDMLGRSVFADLEKLPHLAIAGQSGSGKSEMLHAILCSLMLVRPDTILAWIDLKSTELRMYQGRYVKKTATNIDDAISVLQWLTAEMNSRNTTFAEAGCRNRKDYNKKHPENKIPALVLVIDEIAMLTNANVFKESGEIDFARRKEILTQVTVLFDLLARVARSCGIHVIIATQYPTDATIPSEIMINFGGRIAMSVENEGNSRVILGKGGAEKLFGMGDALWRMSDKHLQRVQGAYLGTEKLMGLCEMFGRRP